MAKALDLAVALAFLSDLAKNNNKAWFEAHRERYVAFLT